jgi:hypothetical protein
LRTARTAQHFHNITHTHRPRRTAHTLLAIHVRRCRQLSTSSVTRLRTRHGARALVPEARLRGMAAAQVPGSHQGGSRPVRHARLHLLRAAAAADRRQSSAAQRESVWRLMAAAAAVQPAGGYCAPLEPPNTFTTSHTHTALAAPRTPCSPSMSVDVDNCVDNCVDN